MFSDQLDEKFSRLTLEMANVTFTFKEFDLWPYIRGRLYDRAIRKEVAREVGARMPLFAFALMFFLSISNYLILLARRTSFRQVYFNSSAGFHHVDDGIVDCYSGYKLNFNNDVLYAVNFHKLSLLPGYLDLFRSRNFISDNCFFKVLSFLVRPFVRARVHLSIRENETIEVARVLKVIDQELPGLVTRELLVSMIADYGSQYFTYRALLSPLRVRDALVVSSYTKIPLINALKKNEFKLSEAQHGLGGKNEFAYNMDFADGVPRQPHIDVLYVFNQFWADSFAQCSLFRDTDIIVAGNKKLELAGEERPPPLFLHKKVILVTGQGQFYSELSILISEMLEVFGEEFIVVYRPHPKESFEFLEYCEKFDKDRFCYFDQRIFLTELLIKHCYIHISVYSACHFDAIHFKGVTYCFDIMSDTPIRSYLDGMTSFVCFKNAEELKDSLDP